MRPVFLFLSQRKEILNCLVSQQQIGKSKANGISKTLTKGDPWQGDGAGGANPVILQP
jgi:hypothetical protein